MFIDDGDGLGVLTAEECHARLRATAVRVGRLGFVHDGYPVVVPVNYAFLHSQIVFQTGLGSKLEAVLRGALLCFEVDELDPTVETGWSVIVQGQAQALTGKDAHAAQRLNLHTWAPGSRSRYIGILVHRISGRQIQ